MRVALLKGLSQYGVLRDFVDEIAAGFVRRGWDAQVLDFPETCDLSLDLPRALAAAGPQDLVFSVNAFAECRDSAGRTVADLAAAPHVLEYVDYPLNFVERFRNIPSETAVLLVDRSHIRMVDALFGENRFAYLGFCPHGGLGTPALMPATAAEWAAQRPIAVLFAGTNYRPDRAGWAALPEHVRDLFQAAVDMALAAEWISPLEAVDSVLTACGLDPNNPSLGEAGRNDLRQVRLLTVLVQEAVRCERRQRFLQAARKVGLPFTVVGNLWDGVPGVDNRGPVEIAECLQLMRRSRLAFSLSGNFGEGSHERPLSAMLGGAAVACDRTSFYESAFVLGRDIALFRWLALEEDLAGIAALLRDPEALFAMAEAGHKAAAAAHRWDHRVDTIIAAGRAAARKLGHASVLAA